MDPKLLNLQESNSSDKEEALNLLHQEEEVKEEVQEEEPEEKEEEQEEEKEEIKLVPDEEEQESEIDLEVPNRRQEVLKKYPNLYKEFPFLEKSTYKAREYTELFGTVDDAKEILGKAQEYERYQQDINQGNLENVLRTVKESDQESYARLVDNYLPNLAKVDTQAYYTVLHNVLRNAIVSMSSEAKRSNNETLNEAAAVLNQYVFGTDDIPEPRSLQKGTAESEAERKLQEERQKFVQERYQSTYSDLSNRVANILKSTINQHIDPRGSMTEYVKKNAINDALNLTQDAVVQDKTFLRTINNLWKRAFDSNFDKKSVDAIRSAYLSKAKTVLPETIRKARSEALKGVSRNSEARQDSRPPINRGRSTSSNTNSGKGKEIPKGMSTLDYLMSD